MAAHSRQVNQLATYETKSFINVDDTLQGQLVLYGNCLTSPTYLMTKGNEWVLVVFDSPARAEENLKITRYYDSVWQFVGDGLAQIVGTKDAS